MLHTRHWWSRFNNIRSVQMCQPIISATTCICAAPPPYRMLGQCELSTVYHWVVHVALCSTCHCQLCNVSWVCHGMLSCCAKLVLSTSPVNHCSDGLTDVIIFTRIFSFAAGGAYSIGDWCPDVCVSPNFLQIATPPPTVFFLILT